MFAPRTVLTAAVTATLALGAGALTAPSSAAPAPPAVPGAKQAPPGEPTVFDSADKEGYGTAYGPRSKVWFTMRAGTLSDVYYPTNSTPSVRSMQLVITDGETFTDTEAADTTHRIRLLDRRSLTYRQVNTAKSGDYRIVKTYVSDPRRATVLVRIRFVSLTGDPYRVYVDHLPALDNAGNAGTARRAGSRLVAKGPRSFGVVDARPSLGASTNEFHGPNGGLAQLEQDFRLTRHRAAARGGAVEQTALTRLTGVGKRTDLTVALSFAGAKRPALHAARRSLQQGFAPTARDYRRGWHRYLDSLRRPPEILSTARERAAYQVSVMVLAAGEDKTFRGAFVASPSMPWAWRRPETNAPNPTGPYHLVWSRDLYQIATGLLAAGDRGAAERSVHYLFNRQQKPGGGFPQNSTAAGKEYWTGHQLDQYALPIVLAWQLGDHSKNTWIGVRKAARAILREGPVTEQERWENQGGYSPATIAAEIAGLVCAADLARDRGHRELARTYLRVADRWQRNVKNWTLTRNGPLSERPYFLRITKDGKPNLGTTYAIGDSGPAAVDQRRVVDPSFLELVRLGVLSPRDRAIRSTLRVVDARISKRTPHGRFWHRFSFDGYGETATGGDWVIQDEGTPKTYGRLWPLLTGERGEYAIAARQPAARYLHTMASTATRGFMMAEQVWDGRPPTGSPGKRLATVTRSATPLLWTHAQFVRLAWSLERGKVVEQPRIVHERYVD